MANRLDRRDKGQEKLQENVDLKQLCLREWGGHDILVGGTQFCGEDEFELK